ncbi:MAG TPA: DUF881 domain-containing protein, partial [Candidatus Limnocylindrales bacterium]
RLAVSVLVGRVRRIPSWQITLGLALLALGFLIAAQLAAEGPRIRYTSQERTPLVETVGELQTQQDQLKQQVLDARSAIQGLEAAGEGGAAVTKQLSDQLQNAQIAAGLVSMTGPGLVMQLSDSKMPVPADGNSHDYLVSGGDVLTVVDQLWAAGAEGIAINGERVVVSTAIVDIGGSVVVNGAYVAAPYQVSAIGPATMFDTLTHEPGFVDFIRARSEAYGIEVQYATPDSVDLPAYAGSTNLRYGRATATPQPSAAP